MAAGRSTLSATFSLIFSVLTMDRGLGERALLADGWAAAAATADVSRATAPRHASKARGRVFGTTLMGFLLRD
jgi:hypothetical protein